MREVGMRNRHSALIAAVLAMCVCAGVLFSMHVSAAAAPSLFHRDDYWYRDSSAGLEIINGVYYVPVDIFGMFSQIELSMDSPRGEFMVYNRTTKNYISVLYKEKIATVNGEEEIYLNLYKLHGGYYYVPAEYFCSVLSLSCTVMESSNAVYGVSLRISDGTEGKTFEELLRPYTTSAPASSSEESSSPPVTAPPPVTSSDDTAFRENYLTFNTISSYNLPEMLSILEDYGVYATFFFTKQELSAYPQLVISVAASGHSIGLRCTSASDETDFLCQMQEANEYLYSLIKMETRIVQLPAGTAKSGFTESQIDAVTEQGYVLWDWTYDVPDSAGYSAAYVEALCERAIRQGEKNVLRMSCNDTVVRLLPGLLNFLQNHPNYQTEQIRACEQEIRFDAVQDKEP